MAERPALFFCTRATQMKDQVGIPYHAGVWGLARTARVEYEGAEIGCVDVASKGDSPAEQLKRAATKCGQPAFEAEIVLRGSEQFVSRLGEAEVPEASDLKFRAKATYIISGGVGALGLLAAKMIVDGGAKNVVLLSRSGVPPEDSRAALERLQATAGVTVTSMKCDVADAASVKAMFAEVKKTLPAVKGIFHAAGFLQDQMLKDMTREGLEPVLKPKIDGTLNLHNFCQDKLDHFVLYSSASSMLGNVGQANYSAANAFMDALAGYRRAQGLAGTSIQWGPWGEVNLF